MKALEVAHAIRTDCLCFRARRAARVITRAYDEALRPLGIQATQLTLMSAIAAAGESGQPMGRIADILAIDAATLSRNLKLLDKAGLVAISRHEGDRRVRIVRLTAEGDRVLRASYPLWQQAQAAVVASLGGADARDRLRRQLDEAAEAVQTAFDF
ncbi:MarR family winged helix-turn-helix transcriptional regulator [Sphingosinicella sp. BN140058]|uniref:MarR family winged helix-turn-helix transcriptional regulator n=1 Tax=Sphingosinicella sp. BN140058 TaxID=1892855 RepID=UPI001011F4B5|nr:MarR family winged helix-turn-helix transcriptional regulator [Sphingosinicella sp. BN140058]QAY77176.1 MarR family transcriptional regulator [Sphingosinicella sp. BN140058]